MILLVASILLLAQQDPFPKAGADPTGVVVDRAGRKVAGASVALHLDAARSRPWSLAIQQVLRETPLPSGASDRDGEFVLPLARDQRLLGRGGEGSFWLVVEKPGYQRWVEPLSGGLDGYLGSRVVLDELLESDRVTVVVEEPEPGMAVTLSRHQATWLEGAEKRAVPADGKVSVLMPLLSSPVPAVEPHRTVPVGLLAELWRGDRSCGRKALLPGATIRWPKAEWSAPREGTRRPPGSRPSSAAASAEAAWGVLVRVRDQDGRPVRGAIVLCTDSAADSGRGPFQGPVQHSDERGEVRVRGIAAGTPATALRVFADGLLFEECRVERQAGEGVVEVAAVPSQRVRVVVTDRERRPLPFVALRVAQPAAIGNPYDPKTRAVVSDSLGRVSVTIASPQDQGATLRCGSDVATLDPSADAPRVEFDAPTMVLVRKALDDVVTQVELRYRGGASGTSGRVVAETCGLLAMLGEDDPHASLRLTMASGPPITVVADDVRAAPRVRGVAVVDRSRAARRIPLRVLGHDGKPVERLAMAVESGSVSTLGIGRNNEPLVELGRADDGTWVLPSHDLRSIATALLEPEHLPYPLSIPGRGERDTDHPIEVRLERGAMLALRLVPKDFGMPTSALGMWSIELTSLEDKNRVERHRFDYGTIGKEQYERPMGFPCRRAFRPGKYLVKVYSRGKPIEREVELELGKLTTLDLTAPESAATSRPDDKR